MCIDEIIKPTSNQWLHDQIVNGRVADLTQELYESLAKKTDDFTMLPHEAFSENTIDDIIDELSIIINLVNTTFSNTRTVTHYFKNDMQQYFHEYLGGS